MINQVQMISMLGRTGGSHGFPSNKVFSNGFVWSNLDAATGGRAQGASPCVGTLCINTDLLSIIASAMMRIAPGADVGIGLGIESCVCLRMFCVRLCFALTCVRLCARAFACVCYADSLRRKEELSAGECDSDAGPHLLKKFFIFCGVLIGIALGREGARRLYARKFPAVTNPPDMTFPAWEGHTVGILLVGMSDAASKAIVSRCLTWALFGAFTLLLLFCTIVYGSFRIRYLMYRELLVFLKHQGREISQVRADFPPPANKSIISRAGWMARFANTLLSDRRFRGDWVKKSAEAKFWGFFVENTGGMWFSCALGPTLKLLVPAILNWTNGILNAVMIVCILWGYWIISFFLHGHSDNLINVGGAFIDLGNALAVTLTALHVILPKDMVPTWIDGPLALYCLLASTILSVLIAIAEPSAQALAAVGKKISGRLVSVTDPVLQSENLSKNQIPANYGDVKMLVRAGKSIFLSTDASAQQPQELKESVHETPYLVDLWREQSQPRCKTPTLSYTTPPERSNLNAVSIAPRHNDSSTTREVQSTEQHYLEHLPGVVNVDSMAGLELLTPRPEVNVSSVIFCVYSNTIAKCICLALCAQI